MVFMLKFSCTLFWNLYMKKVLIMFFLLIFTPVQVCALGNNNAGIGVKLLKDPYSRKTIVFQIYPNSPAEKAGLPLGCCILKINDKEIKNLSLDEINSLIQGPQNSHLTLTVKTFSINYLNGYRSKQFDIVRDIYDIPISKYDNDNRFWVHWQQVPPTGFANVDYIPWQVDAQLSRNYRMINNINVQNYWYDRKIQFQKGYDACLLYNKNEQNNCLMNLVNREVSKTSQDKTIKLQEQMVRLQRIQNWNQIDTNSNLNNINNSLNQINNTLKGY